MECIANYIGTSESCTKLASRMYKVGINIKYILGTI